MKSIEEIKNEIQFAVENKKIDGFIENDCLYIESPAGESIIMIALSILLPVLALIFGLISCLTDFGVNYFLIILLLDFLAMILVYKLGKDYIVYDYNLGKIFYSSKLFNKTICKSSYLDVREIAEIGINNVYEPRRDNNNIFKTPKNDEVFECHFKSGIVYLNTEGKLKKLSAYVYDKQKKENKLLLENLSKFANFLASLLEIPCKICEKNQKLEVITNEGSFRKSLNIIPIDLKKEKKDRFVLLTKLFILRLILTVFLPFHIFLIYQYGFWGAFQAWPKMIHLLITRVIPNLLGLN